MYDSGIEVSESMTDVQVDRLAASLALEGGVSADNLR